MQKVHFCSKSEKRSSQTFASYEKVKKITSARKRSSQSYGPWWKEEKHFCTPLGLQKYSKEV